MALIGQVTIQQMIDDIKVESRVKGADNLNVTILAIINELLLAHTETERYAAFIKTGVPIVLVAAQGKYTLPEDLQNIRTVYWWRQGQGEESRVLRHKNDFVERSRDGVEPKYYEIVGDELSIWPHANILLTDTLTIDYWGQPNALEVTDTFPVTKLYPVIKREAIARVHTFNKDFNSADRFKQDGDAQDKQSQTTEDNGDTA